MQLEELSISAEDNPTAWGVGMDCIPQQWSKLTSLHMLQLRGHTMLSVRGLAQFPYSALADCVCVDSCKGLHRAAELFWWIHAVQ